MFPVRVELIEVVATRKLQLNQDLKASEGPAQLCHAGMLGYKLNQPHG